MKRFTDTAIWQDEWFMNLSPDYKLAFMFIKDNCDCAGVYKPNKRLAELMIGIPIEWEDFLNSCDGRIKLVQGGYWWITKFVDFQYGTLSENCKPHIKVIETLKKYNLYKGYTKGNNTLEEKEEDKEEEKEEEEEKEGKPKKEKFADLVSMTNDQHSKLIHAYGEEITKACITVLDNYKGSSGKKYKDDYRAILSWVVGKVQKERSGTQSKSLSLLEQDAELRRRNEL